MLSTMGQSCRELEGELSGLVASEMCAITHGKYRRQIQKCKMLHPHLVIIRISCYESSLWKNMDLALVFSVGMCGSLGLKFALTTLFVRCCGHKV